MPKKEISLLPEKNAVKTLGDKFVKWVLSFGKYIVIFTQLIVISAFLSRFWLDRTNTDLTDRIRQQRAILASSQSFEQEFRLFQTRLSKINQSFDRTDKPLDTLSVISRSMPPDVLLTDFSFTKNETENRVNLKTRIFSEVGLAEFIDQLISQPEISSVQIGAIEKEEGKGGMSIDFTVNFKADRQADE